MMRRFKPAFVQSFSYRRFNDILARSENPADMLSREADGKVSFLELFIESVYLRRLSLSNGDIRVIADETVEGFGLRVIRGRQVQYYFINHLGFGLAEDFFGAIREMISGAFTGAAQKIIPIDDRISVCHEPEIRMLNIAYDTARKTNWRLESVAAEWKESCRSFRVLNSEQIDAAGQDHLVSFSVQSSLRNGSAVYQGRTSSGGRCAPDNNPELRPEIAGKEAAEEAEKQKSAKPCQSGVYPVILAAGRCGAVIHEMIAHPLEADVVLNGLSCFSGMIGNRVAPQYVNVVDDGTLANGRGTSETDDEGAPSLRTVLIENGILKNFLHDRLTSRKMGVAPTSSARRENFAYPPMPRSRNTFIESSAAGTEDDLIRSVKKGLYATSVTRGQVDPYTGTFVFTVQDGFWIENGKPAFPVRPAMMMGNSLEILAQIGAAGNNMILETSSGDCVKDGQRIPVSYGHPALRINPVLIQPYS